MSRGLLWTGALITAAQVVLYLTSASTTHKTIGLGPGWTNRNAATLENDVSVFTLYKSASPGCGWIETPVFCPPRVYIAAQPGDTIVIRHTEYRLFFLDNVPSSTICRIERPGGSQHFFSTPDGVLFGGMVASLLIPSLLCIVIAIELDARRGIA